MDSRPQLQANRIAQILERALPRHVLKSFDLLSGSVSNLIYLLRFFGTEPPVVLRVYVRDSSACQKEVDILRSGQRQLPVPELIYANPKGEDDVGPYVLYRYAEGMTFQELKSQGNLQDMAEAAYAIGAALARLQTVSLSEPVSGRREITGECLNSPVLEHRLGGTDRDRLGVFFSAWLPRIRHLYHDRVLVHGDFNNRNTIVKREGNRWVVTGILDWEYAFVGSPLWDASRFICFERRAWPCREPHFSRGFCDSGGSLPEDWSVFSRTLNALSAAESLSRVDLREQYIPDLRDLILATLDGRDLA
jgi:aminoglycoside phosphotransferase (APT) family kinase protein